MATEGGKKPRPVLINVYEGSLAACFAAAIFCMIAEDHGRDDVMISLERTPRAFFGNGFDADADVFYIGCYPWGTEDAPSAGSGCVHVIVPARLLEMFDISVCIDAPHWDLVAVGDDESLVRVALAVLLDGAAVTRAGFESMCAHADDAAWWRTPSAHAVMRAHTARRRWQMMVPSKQRIVPYSYLASWARSVCEEADDRPSDATLRTFRSIGDEYGLMQPLYVQLAEPSEQWDGVAVALRLDAASNARVLLTRLLADHPRYKVAVGIWRTPVPGDAPLHTAVLRSNVMKTFPGCERWFDVYSTFADAPTAADACALPDSIVRTLSAHPPEACKRPRANQE